MWAAPALLVVLVIVIGVAPFLAEGIVTAAANAVTGADLHPHLKIWHGVTPALWMSIIAVVGGAILLTQHGWMDKGVERGCHGPRQRRSSTGWSPPSSPRRARSPRSATTVRSVAISPSSRPPRWCLDTSPTPPAACRRRRASLLPVAPVIAVGWVMLIVATVSVVTMHHHRFRALVLIGIIGLSISAGFAYLSAPDLALTQISVETVTIMLLLLALHFMPKSTPKESPMGLKLRDGAIALGAGGGVAALAYAFLMRDIETISDYHIANSYEGGGGTNVVNVILVDFRGYDTFGEIIVLGIAGLVIYAMMHALLDGPAARRLKNADYSHNQSRDRHPLMMVVVTRVLMPIAMVVGLYIFLRGHNEPGGGFVAGLVIAIALLMQYMASGFAWTQERKRIEYHTMIGLAS
jgi:multicomponent K+:H+ antiporter subunit A